MVGKMHHLQLPFIEMKKNNTNHIEFNPKEVYAHMTKKKWINSYGKETEVVEKNPGLQGDFFAF